MTGNIGSVAAGRISFSFGFNGPTIMVDTACSSSLVATHLASTSLFMRECSTAVVGGVNAILGPWGTVNIMSVTCTFSRWLLPHF